MEADVLHVAADDVALVLASVRCWTDVAPVVEADEVRVSGLLGDAVGVGPCSATNLVRGLDLRVVEERVVARPQLDQCRDRWAGDRVVPGSGEDAGDGLCGDD